MNVFERVIERAKTDPSRIAFPEATEEKMLQAIRQATDSGVCIPVLVGHEDEIRAAAQEAGIDISDMEIFDTLDEEKLGDVIDRYVQTNEFLSVKTMKRKSGKDPMYAALMTTALGDTDATFAGLSHSTGDVILGAQTVIGMAEGVESVSGMGIWELTEDIVEGGVLGHADAAVNPDPTAEQLADTAICAADAMQALLGVEPRVAMLSFSTTGSTEHPLADKVIRAVAIANERRPDLKIDGEFQFDSAINPAVAAKKVKRESEVAGHANFVLFPDLNAGNIGVKLVQQIAHVNAPGPFLLGFKKVVGDCSRGAPIAELVGNIAACSVRAKF